MSMVIRLTIIMLLALIVMNFCGLTCGTVEDGSVSRKKLLKHERKRNLVEKQAVKSIQSEDGDIIDCIDIYKQPAFKHPAMRNHSIQMTPSFSPKMETKSSTEEKQKYSVSQIWQRSGSCPKGTVPVRRAQKKDSAENWRKKPRLSQHFKHLDDNQTFNLLLPNHSVARLLTGGFSYLGAKADITVWNPNVETDDEYSTSQVSLKTGHYSDYEVVESGWAVNPSVYGDRKTRFFVYWTTDASKTTGCFDLTCPGFVQTSSEIALGAAIYPISVHQGLPYEIIVYIFKDPYTNNWWVQYGERINIGYWPPDIFNLLRYHAEAAHWGGEVYSPRVGVRPHTRTGMGSGRFPDFVFGNSGSFKRIRVLENSMEPRFPEWVQTYSDEYDCYGVLYHGDYVADPEFYYGGPGKNPMCP